MVSLARKNLLHDRMRSAITVAGVDPSRPTDTRILAVKVAFDAPSPLRLGTTVELRIRAAKR